MADQAAVVGQRDLFLVQQADEIAHLGPHLAVLPAEQTILMVVRKIFTAERVECFLGLVLAERDEFAHQFRIAAGISLVDQFVVSRQALYSHLMHGRGDTECDARGWVLDLLHGSFPDREGERLDVAGL
ncbi:hypothetical protein D3C72_2142780 [compost metagenome]